jgi:hypothetical protein
MTNLKPYPELVCSDCGLKYGLPKGGVSTFHMNKCDVCGKNKPVTEPRDYSNPDFPGHKTYYQSFTKEQKENYYKNRQYSDFSLR